MRERVVMIDAGFEAVLGTVLVMGWAFGGVDGDDFPGPASSGLTLAFGVAVWLLSVALAGLVSRDAVTDAVLGALAATNAAFAALLLVWILVADGFSTTGVAVVWVTIAMLLLLAANQALLRRG